MVEENKASENAEPKKEENPYGALAIFFFVAFFGSAVYITFF